jgi:hypothetical protein
MADERKAIRQLFFKLRRAKQQTFPKARERMTHVPDEQGVYVIYSPGAMKIVHVGRTYKGTAGLRQRLKNHLHGSSSFTEQYLI